MSIHHLPVPKRYNDIKVLAKDIIADYPDITSGIIILFDQDGSMLQYQCCTKSQMAFAAADLLVKSTVDEP